jgi:hypothetical protein
MSGVHRRVRLPLAIVVLASGFALAAGGALASAAPNRVSIEILPSGKGLDGVSFFKVRVSGVATLASRGPWAGQRDALFVFAGQTEPCAVDAPTNVSLQTDGQGFQYEVGPGAFSVIVTGFADSSWKNGHFCAYLSPLDFNLERAGIAPLGAVVARATRTINVHRFGQV